MARVPERADDVAKGCERELVQFFTPIIISCIATPPLAKGHGLGAGISIGAAFAVFTRLWVWTLPETRGTEIKA